MPSRSSVYQYLQWWCKDLEQQRHTHEFRRRRCLSMEHRSAKVVEGSRVTGLRRFCVGGGANLSRRALVAATCEGVDGGDLRRNWRRRPARVLVAATCEGIGGGGGLGRNRRRRPAREEGSRPGWGAACAPDAAATTSPGVRRQWLAPQVRRRRLRAAAACSLGGALAAGCLKSETVRWEWGFGGQRKRILFF